MARVELVTCDMPDVKSGKPCGEKGVVEAVVSQDGKSYRTDLCEMHGQALVNAGQPVTASPSRAAVTVLPRAGSGRKVSEQLVDKVDYVDLRAWAEGAGLLQAGSRGRIRAEIQQKWLDEGSPRPV